LNAYLCWAKRTWDGRNYLVVIKEEILGKVTQKNPFNVGYKCITIRKVVYTPAVFPVMFSMLTWNGFKLGGLLLLREINEKKGALFVLRNRFESLFKATHK